MSSVCIYSGLPLHLSFILSPHYRHHLYYLLHLIAWTDFSIPSSLHLAHVSCFLLSWSLLLLLLSSCVFVLLSLIAFDSIVSTQLSVGSPLVFRFSSVSLRPEDSLSTTPAFDRPPYAVHRMHHKRIISDRHSHMMMPSRQLPFGKFLYVVNPLRAPPDSL